MNWPRFLEQHRINYVTSGPNTARDNINIKCPWCGDSDPSEHLGISLGTGYWGCWRNSRHRGRRAEHLIQALIHCSYEEAQRIAGVRTVITVSDATFKSYVRGVMTKETKAPENTKLQFTPDIKELIRMRFGERQIPLWLPYHFMHYLRQKRGFSIQEAVDVASLYELRFALTGPYRYRIVFPIYDNKKRLLTWTGRAIGNSTIRYKTLSADAEKAKEEGTPQALASIKDCLWNHHELAHTFCDKLIICEGPFDSLRLDYYGRSLGVRSTCLFGKSISVSQIDLLSALRPLCSNLYITLDADSATDMTRIAAHLAHLDCEVKRLPEGVDDPAMLTKEEIQTWVG